MPGLFITFEGGEGSGKSTQIKLFADYLKEQNVNILLTREPGATPDGKIIREYLLKGNKEIPPTVEMALFFSDRRIHLMETVWPAMDKGITVISDRFADSTMAYQGYGYGGSAESVERINRFYRNFVGDFKPDFTFILDIDPKIGLKRSFDRAGNDETRFENMDFSFHENLRAAFLRIADENPKRCHVINANQTPAAVHTEIIAAFKERFKS